LTPKEHSTDAAVPAEEVEVIDTTGHVVAVVDRA
jgi:hypothetical protein